VQLEAFLNKFWSRVVVGNMHMCLDMSSFNTIYRHADEVQFSLYPSKMNFSYWATNSSTAWLPTSC